MLKNYLKIALRNMGRQKLYSGLNIFGLAIGLACFVLIFVFVQYERSFDRFYNDADDIYRMVHRQPNNVFMGNDRFAVTPVPLAGALVNDFPEVIAATTFRNNRVLLKQGDTYFYETGLWADSSFFDVFALPLVVGDAEAVLSDPSNMLLSESLARKIFGDEPAVGQQIEAEQWGTTYAFTVAGIIRDLPENTHLNFGYILPFHANADYLNYLDEWRQNGYLTYFRMQEGATGEALQAKMPAFLSSHMNEEDAARYEYIVEAMQDVHLYSDVNFDIGTAEGNIQYLYLLAAIGIVILLLACVNYMNLAVARSIKRAKEVGLRQVIGAHRRQITGQFLSESILMTALALGLGLILVYLFLPVFSGLVERPLHLDWSAPWFLPGLILLALAVGFLSGSYPALYMARLRPIHTLKGKLSGPKHTGLQKGLIVVQFAASIALIAASMIIYQQLQFIQQKDVGYNREQVVTVRLQGRGWGDKIEQVQQQIKQLPNVTAVSAGSHLPINLDSSSGISFWDGSREGETLTLYNMIVGYDFPDVFDTELVTGQWFSPAVSSDTVESLVINETAVRALDWTIDNALGKRIDEYGRVIGVMKDFHLHSLHLPIAPMMARMDNPWYSYVAVRIAPQNMAATMASITSIIKGYTPYPVSPQFLDDAFDALYKSDRRLGAALGYFTILALLIASFGLFGLAAFATESRSKEIGVRKVLGASVAGLVALLSREFLILVGLGIVLAVPIAYFSMQRWLDTFAYRIDLGVGLFLVTAIAAIAIAVLTVSYQAIKAALANPVKSLRYE